MVTPSISGELYHSSLLFSRSEMERVQFHQCHRLRTWRKDYHPSALEAVLLNLALRRLRGVTVFPL
jgi:hypothetical protein